jgi:hypothetical protein
MPAPEGWDTNARSGLQLLQVFEILPQAVTGEPFSTADSLLSRENTGNFRDSGPYWLLRQNLKNLQKLQSQPCGCLRVGREFLDSLPSEPTGLHRPRFSHARHERWGRSGAACAGKACRRQLSLFPAMMSCKAALSACPPVRSPISASRSATKNSSRRFIEPSAAASRQVREGVTVSRAAHGLRHRNRRRTSSEWKTVRSA